MISAALTLCAFALIILLVTARLRDAGYSSGICAVLPFFLALQLATAVAARALFALALALVLVLVAESATALARVRSVRNVVTLSVSLAAAQLVNPLGVAVTAILVPALAVLQTPTETRNRNTGLLIVLLFIPVAATLTLAYLAQEFRFDPLLWLASPFDHLIRAQIFDRASPEANGLINAAAMAVMACPIWFLAMRSRPARIVALVAAALIGAAIVTALLHRSYSLAAFAPSFAGLSFLSFAERGEEAMPAEHLIALAALSTMASWLIIAIPM